MLPVDYSDCFPTLSSGRPQRCSVLLKETFTCEEIEDLRLRISKYGVVCLSDYHLQDVGIREEDGLGVLYATRVKTGCCYRLFLHSFLVYSICPDGTWVARHDLDVAYDRVPGKESFNMTAWSQWQARPWWKRWFRKQPASLGLEEQMERWNVHEAPEIDWDTPERQAELEAWGMAVPAPAPEKDCDT